MAHEENAANGVTAQGEEAFSAVLRTRVTQREPELAERARTRGSPPFGTIRPRAIDGVASEGREPLRAEFQ